MVINGKDIGGTFLIHDETLYELYCWNKWMPTNLEPIHPFKLRELGTNIDYSYLCFHDITRNSNKNKYIVHNYILENIFKNHYNVENITTIKYPVFNLNIIDKLNKYEISRIKQCLNINSKKLNLLVIGGISDTKLPNYAFKILDKLIEKGLDTELYIFNNK
jgi:hypothetical protein